MPGWMHGATMLAWIEACMELCDVFLQGHARKGLSILSSDILYPTPVSWGVSVCYSTVCAGISMHGPAVATSASPGEVVGRKSKGHCMDRCGGRVWGRHLSSIHEAWRELRPTCCIRRAVRTGKALYIFISVHVPSSE